MANIFQEQIQAEKPKAVASERIYVYVPRATVDTPGIASYDDTYFRLNAGKVYLKKTDPTERPSLIEIDDKANGLTYDNGYLKTYLKTINGESVNGPGNIKLVTPSQLTSAIDEHNESGTAHQDIRDAITTAVSNHNQSPTAHSDIRADVLANTGRIGDIEDLIPSGTTQANPLVNESQMTTITDALSIRVSGIESKIPLEASSSNQLADKNFVNSSIATNTANFKGTYNIVTDLGLTISATEQQIASALENEISSPTNNDYCFVAYPNTTVSTQYDKFDRYKYSEEDGEWQYEFTLNNSSFTAQQWAAINSGITAGLVSKIGTAILTTTAQDLSDAVNEINAKVQIATRNIAGTVFAWEDANGFHIWLSNPNEVDVQTAQNIQGGLTYTIKTMDYTETENLSGGLTIEIGEGE